MDANVPCQTRAGDWGEMFNIGCEGDLSVSSGKENIGMALESMCGRRHLNMRQQQITRTVPSPRIVLPTIASLAFKGFTIVLLVSMMFSPVQAVFVNFENCLSSDILTQNVDGQYHLQWVPQHVWVSLNKSDNYNLNMTVYGNVKGQPTQGTLPSPNNSSYWDNPNNTFGKIVDQDPINHKWATLFARFGVLNYVPYGPSTGVRFCNSTLNTECPIGPLFN